MSSPLKSSAEIETMRKAGRILAEILKKLGEAVEPGKTPMDLERLAEKICQEHNAEPGFKGYHGYPNICCISVNNTVVHGIPNNVPFERGDLVTIDCGVKLNGLNTDAAISVIAGGDECGSEQTRKLNETTRKALYAGIAQVKPGAKIGDIGHAIQTVVEGAGFSIIKNLTGHGIGYKLHEDPQILNYGKKGTGESLVPGMTIAIEPIVSAGERFIETLNDHWTIVLRDGSLGCQWEHTILVTQNGHEILTTLL